MNAENICFSIGIPVYNKKKYLDRCISSVCGQTYKNLEIILVDDGSTDGSGAMLDEWALRDERIAVIHQENGGAAVARNTAIDHAKGDFIVFIDADDFVDERLCELVLQKFCETNSDCILYEHYIVAEKDKWICAHSEQQLSWETGNADFYKRLFGRELALIGTSAWTKVFRTTLIRERNIRFPTQKVGEDMQFCLIYAWESKRWDRINKPLYYYCQNADSVMHDYNPAFENEIRIQMESVERFARERGIFAELESAICCVQLRDCLTMCKYIYMTSRNMRDTIGKLKKFTGESFYRSRFLGADRKLLNMKYKVFHTLLVHRQAYLLTAMMHFYFRRYQ